MQSILYALHDSLSNPNWLSLGVCVCVYKQTQKCMFTYVYVTTIILKSSHEVERE